VPASFQAATPTPAASATPVPTASAQPTAGGTYTVQPGDFLSGIGVKFGIPWQLIATANNIEPPDYTIIPGQVLIIPVLPQPSDGSNTYVVLAGDNITKIAAKFGLDPTTLADFNNLVDWNSIHPGDILYIPTTPDATPRTVPSPTE
jgi:LysM repeat protein